MYKQLVRRTLFRFGGGDPEVAHERTLGVLRRVAAMPPVLSALRARYAVVAPRTVFGVRFPNPVGLAAGFDKDGKLVPLMPALGFGFLEIGSVTLEPQPGNPHPRLFRDPAARAVVNRMGFNSEGARRVARRLASRPKCAVPLGINLGLNKGTEPAKAPAAYKRTFAILAEHGDYFVVNVSSPNTPGLRDLQKVDELAAILEAVQEANAFKKPVLLKLAPDLADEDFAAAIATAEKLAQGLVVCNTTISREGVDARLKDEKGGLSGAPLKARALKLARRARSLTKLPLIGVGGIETAADAKERLEAGADLIQLYTGLIYGGPGAPKKILRGLA